MIGTCNMIVNHCVFEVRNEARDTIDLLAPNMEQLLANPNLTLFASSAQLQKVFRAVYYPTIYLAI